MLTTIRLVRPAAVLAGLLPVFATGSSLAAQGLRAPLEAGYIVEHVANVARSYVEIGTVRSPTDATIEIREDRQDGALLGLARVHAGANPSVKVQLTRRPTSDVIAVLRSGDEVLATAELERDF